MESRTDGRIGRMRLIAIAGALACVASVASIVHHGGGPAAKTTQATLLASGTDFGLSGTVGDLTPGISSHLALTVTNPNGSPIRLRTVTVAVPVVPAGCPVADLTIASRAFTGSPPAVTVTGLSAAVPAGGTATVRVAILLARHAPNGCQQVRFPFDYTGVATTGTTARATVTSLTSFPDPSEAGEPVAFIAIVEAMPLDQPQPAGYVTFYECTDPASLPAGSPALACSTSVSLGPPEVTAPDRPAILIVASLGPGSHSIFARFRPEIPGFAASASTTITQSVVFAGPGIGASIWTSAAPRGLRHGRPAEMRPR